jgi:hypothetical protein
MIRIAEWTSVSGGSIPPTATRYFLFDFFFTEQRAQVEKQPQLVYKTITYATQ